MSDNLKDKAIQFFDQIKAKLQKGGEEDAEHDSEGTVTSTSTDASVGNGESQTILDKLKEKFTQITNFKKQESTESIQEVEEVSETGISEEDIGEDTSPFNLDETSIDDMEATASNADLDNNMTQTSTEANTEGEVNATQLLKENQEVFESEDEDEEDEEEDEDEEASGLDLVKKKLKELTMMQKIIIGAMVFYVASEALITDPPPAPPQSKTAKAKKKSSKKSNKKNNQKTKTAATKKKEEPVQKQEPKEQVQVVENPKPTPKPVVAPEPEPDPIPEPDPVVTEPAVSNNTGNTSYNDMANYKPTTTEQSKNTIDKIIANQKKLVKEQEMMQEEYQPMPDFEIMGRGMVYNCKGKHWACVSKEAFFQCRRNQNWNKVRSLKPECIVKDVYATFQDCRTMQVYNINQSISTNFCEK